MALPRVPAMIPGMIRSCQPLAKAMGLAKIADQQSQRRSGHDTGLQWAMKLDASLPISSIPGPYCAIPVGHRLNRKDFVALTAGENATQNRKK